jgi:hypothetical protein
MASERDVNLPPLFVVVPVYRAQHGVLLCGIRTAS